MTTKITPLEEDKETRLLLNNSLLLLQQGELDKADELLIKVQKLSPNNIDVLNLLGIRSYQKQEFEKALELLHEANLLAPHSAQTLGNIGLVNNALGRFSEALHFLDLSIIENDGIPETHNNRGNALKGLSKTREALEAYSKAISIRPNYAEALNNQGVIFLEVKNLREAVTFFERAIRESPNFSIAYSNLGNALTELENYESAFQCFERAIELNPRYVDAYLNFGNSLKKCKQFFGAIECYQRALKIDPDSETIFNLLGEIYYEIGDSDLAKTYYAKSLGLNPNNLEVQLALTIAQVPKVYRNQVEVLDSREALISQLEFIEADITSINHWEVSDKRLFRHPFYLAYQEMNNEPILSKFGKINVQLAKSIQQKITAPQRKPSPPNKIHLGIVSNYFCNHPVWHAITKGWISHLNPDLFEIYLFNTDGAEDDETVAAKLKGEYFKCNQSVTEIAQFISIQDLDVLLYPEIGMDANSKALACLRLAPLQIAAWGHPETTGLPTIDYYLSGELFETPSSELFYSEKLIKLPNLGTWAELRQLQSANINLEEFGIEPGYPILICAGSPSKYTPNYDDILTEIAQKLGACQFIFFDFEENLTSILKKRISESFAIAKMDVNKFVRFIPFLRKDEFNSLMQQADLYLDTVGFSGFNTAIQALMCNLPIVTIEGNFMRGKLASALLRRMNLDDFICHSNAEYIKKAVELIENQELLNNYRARIAQNNPIIFNDLEPIRRLEILLTKMVRDKNANGAPT